MVVRYVVLHGMVEAYVVVDMEERKVNDFVFDPESFRYEDPPIATDMEGGPVDHNEAYDIAEWEDESDWFYHLRVGDLREVPGLTD